MKYLHGQFGFSFAAWPKETTIKFVFSNQHQELLYAQGDIGGMYITIGPDHFPEIQHHLLSLDANGKDFASSNYLPEWAVSSFVYIEIDLDGEAITLPLNVIEDDVNMQLVSDDSKAPAFRPEVVAGMLKYISSITNGPMPSDKLRALHGDVLRRLGSGEAYEMYQAETLSAVIKIVKKLVMAPALHAASKQVN